MHSRSDMTPARPIRSRLVAFLTGVLALVGCAATLPGLRIGDTSAAGGVIRPKAPPEYDVMVAELARGEGRLDDAAAAYQRAVAKDEESAYLHRKAAQSLTLTNRMQKHGVI